MPALVLCCIKYDWNYENKQNGSEYIEPNENKFLHHRSQNGTAENNNVVCACMCVSEFCVNGIPVVANLIIIIIVMNVSVECKKKKTKKI